MIVRRGWGWVPLLAVTCKVSGTPTAGLSDNNGCHDGYRWLTGTGQNCQALGLSPIEDLATCVTAVRKANRESQAAPYEPGGVFITGVMPRFR